LEFIDENKSKPFCIYYPMALVHSPFIHPPELEELARSKYTDDLDKSTVAFGHMVTYMDHLIGRILTRLKHHGLDRNTLILFTGDNGTGKQITSKIAGMDLKGGKGTMTEAGSRVPLVAWWPGTIRPAVRDEFFCLVDVLPTITSMAGIKLDGKVDGMDLSHHLNGKMGKDRKHVLINHGKGYFVRDQRFRINQDGKFYDIPVSSDKERYSEKQSVDPAHADRRQQLQGILDDFMSIESEYENPGRPKSKDNKIKMKKRK
jgi:arylsulfatase A